MKDIIGQNDSDERTIALRSKLDNVATFLDGGEKVTHSGFSQLKNNVDGVLHKNGFQMKSDLGRFGREVISFFRSSVQMRTFYDEGNVEESEVLDPYLATEQVVGLIVAYSLDGKVRFSPDEHGEFLNKCGNALKSAEKKIAAHLVQSHAS